MSSTLTNGLLAFVQIDSAAAFNLADSMFMDTPPCPAGEIVDNTVLTRQATTDVGVNIGLDAVTSGDPAAGGTGIVARVETSVRTGVLGDVPFLDRLQKAHSRELGFLPTMALEGKVKLGQVLIAEAGGRAVGYLIAADRYCRRDEVGYVTQINVLPEVRRSLVAAALLQAQFDRSAYGCRLYCCWCAQDLKANAFWEAMGFTPIAFRTGSRTKGRDANGKPVPRIHLFWQKRVRAGDTGDVTRGGTPWWYPAQTAGGEMREDRLVFPIPPGVHWRDVLPVVLPETANAGLEPATAAALPSAALPSAALPSAVTSPTSTRAPRLLKPVAPAMNASAARGLRFGPPPRVIGPIEARRTAERAAKLAAKEARKVDPRLTAMARELRDRWSEHVDLVTALPGKHDVRRALAPSAERVGSISVLGSVASGPALLEAA